MPKFYQSLYTEPKISEPLPSAKELEFIRHNYKNFKIFKGKYPQLARPSGANKVDRVFDEPLVSFFSKHKKKYPQLASWIQPSASRSIHAVQYGYDQILSTNKFIRRDTISDKDYKLFRNICIEIGTDLKKSFGTTKAKCPKLITFDPHKSSGPWLTGKKGDNLQVYEEMEKDFWAYLNGEPNDLLKWNQGVKILYRRGHLATDKPKIRNFAIGAMRMTELAQCFAQQLTELLYDANPGCGITPTGKNGLHNLKSFLYQGYLNGDNFSIIDFSKCDSSMQHRLLHCTKEYIMKPLFDFNYVIDENGDEIAVDAVLLEEIFEAVFADCLTLNFVNDFGDLIVPWNKKSNRVLNCGAGSGHPLISLLETLHMRPVVTFLLTIFGHRNVLMLTTGDNVITRHGSNPIDPYKLRSRARNCLGMKINIHESQLNLSNPSSIYTLGKQFNVYGYGHTPAKELINKLFLTERRQSNASVSIQRLVSYVLLNGAENDELYQFMIDFFKSMKFNKIRCILSDDEWRFRSYGMNIEEMVDYLIDGKLNRNEFKLLSHACFLPEKQRFKFSEGRKRNLYLRSRIQGRINILEAKDKMQLD